MVAEDKNDFKDGLEYQSVFIIIFNFLLYNIYHEGIKMFVEHQESNFSLLVLSIP